MVMSADYSFQLIFIEADAPQFIGHNIFFLDSVTTERCSSTMMLFLVVVYLMHLIHGKSDTLTTRSDRLHI